MDQFFQTKFHFIGIGGIGMSGLAELLHNMGAEVSGSDLSVNEQTERLKDLGCKVYQGHKKEYVDNVDVVVYTSAVKSDNPEMQRAVQLEIPQIRRAEALAEIMRLKRGIAIAGTHGKTTTTSFAATIFEGAELDPTIVVGGRLDMIQSTAKRGEGPWLIAEADESDGSFHRLSPEIVVVTNIDNDHIEHYGSFENLKNSFFDFAAQIPFYGVAVVCGDDPVVKEVFKDFPKKILFYGFSEDSDYRLEQVGDEYHIFYDQKNICQFELPLPGRHNALNALAAIICGHIVGANAKQAGESLRQFKGVGRRFHNRGETAKGAIVFDDYAHHPTEISSTLEAVKEAFPNKNIKVIFQPHRYSRFEYCWKGFLQSFENCDDLYVVDVYRAGESPIENINSQVFVKELNHKNANYFEDKAQLLSQLIKEAGKDDVVFTLGAGDIWRMGVDLVEGSVK